jgi:uncharacterized protein YbcI
VKEINEMQNLTEAQRVIVGKQLLKLIDDIKTKYASAMIIVEDMDKKLELAYTEDKLAIKDDIEMNTLLKSIDKVFNKLRKFQTVINDLKIPSKE